MKFDNIYCEYNTVLSSILDLFNILINLSRLEYFILKHIISRVANFRYRVGDKLKKKTTELTILTIENKK